MTTSKKPWSTSPLNPLVVIDALGNGVAEFLRVENAELCVEQVNESDTVAELESKIEDLKKDNQTLEEERDDLDIKVEKLEGKIDSLENDLDYWKNKAQELQVELNEKA